MPAVRLIWNLLKLPFFPIWLLLRSLVRVGSRFRAPAWIVIQLQPSLVEMAPTRPKWLNRLLGLTDRQPTSLHLVREVATEVQNDAHTLGLVLVMRPLKAGWAVAQELRQIILDLRAAGKEVVVHLTEGAGNIDLFVASAADRVTVEPQVTALALGLSAETFYLKPFLDRLGVQLRRFARAEYKTAAENLTRDAMSDPPARAGWRASGRVR